MISHGDLIIPSSAMKPILRSKIPSLYIKLILTFYFYSSASKPWNFCISFVCFLTVHINLDSIGVMCWSISCPCKQSPASILRESRAPRPQNMGNPDFKRVSQNYITSLLATDTSNPSSPIFDCELDTCVTTSIYLIIHSIFGNINHIHKG